MTRDLILVALSLFTWGVGEGMFIYFQPLYLQKLGASPLGIGAILGGMGIAMAITQIPAGYLGDKFGRRPFMYGSWGLGTIAAWIMALSLSLNGFVVGLILYGLTSFVMAPMNSYITNARGKWTVARALTFSSAAYNLGAVAGPFIGGKLADVYGLRLLYVIAASIFILSTIIILFISRQPVAAAPRNADAFHISKNIKFATLMGVLFVSLFSTYLPQPLTSNFLQNERGLSFGLIGTLGSIGSLGNAVLALGLGALNARIGFIVGQLAVIIFSISIWKGTGLPWYLLGYFSLGGYRVSKSLSMALARPLIHQAQMGVAYGFIETVSSVAIIIAPPLAGLLYQQNPVIVYPIAICLIGFAVILSFKFIPKESGVHAEMLVTPERGLD